MRRLYFRIIVGVLAILVLSFFLPGLFFRAPDRESMKPRRPADIDGSARLLKDRLERVAPGQLAGTLDSLRVYFDFPLELKDQSDTSLPIAVRAGMTTEGVISSKTDSDRPTTYLPLGNTGKVLVIGPRSGPSRGPDRHRPDTESIVIMVSITLAVVAVAGFLMVAPVVRNLRSLETAASRFGQGDLDSRAVVRSRDAVGSVARQFNLMAEGIQRLIQRERQLLQAVSHELRTPIARIRFSLDLLNSAQTPEERGQRMGEIDNEVSEIDQLVGELLDYNRLQSESKPLDVQGVAVRPILEEVVMRLKDFRPEIAVEIVPSGNDPCLATADRVSFRRAMQNLFSNAIRFARKRVTIRYYRKDSATVVEVSDDGPGVPPDKRDQVLTPFFRVDDSRSKESGGIGLGLAIVHRIVVLHQGSISIDDADIGGARFTTVWPDRQS